MASPVTLFIVEGIKREVRFLSALANDFMAASREVEILILPAEQNIYMLYEQLERDDFETDIVEILRESSDETAEMLEDMCRDDVDEIFLFFDFDPQHFKHESTENAVTLISKALEKMFSIFDNETELGKLYVSYPMVEALYDYERDSLPCVAHSDCYLSFDDVSRYKHLAGNDNQIASEHKPQWRETLNIFVLRIMCLFELEKLTFSDYRESITPLKIYHMQMQLVNDTKTVFCLSSLPEFLLDYYREDFWDTNIKAQIASYEECGHRPES